MTLQEYQTYCDQFRLNQIEQYLELKYNTKNIEYLLCFFDIYSFDVKRNKVDKSFGKFTPKKADYVLLLSVLLKHPEVTFAELPRFIPEGLYIDMLYFLLFPTTRHISNPDLPIRRRNPIAVEMTTLQEDVKAIAQDEPYNFTLYCDTPDAKFECILVSIWMKKMEIKIDYTIGKRNVVAKYGMIDVEQIKEILHVKTYKGIDGALYRISQKLPEAKSDIMWIKRWLDNHGVKYVHAEDERIEK